MSQPPEPAAPSARRAPLSEATPSPCIGVCSTTSVGDVVCRGCKRFAHEVVDWNGYSDEQKQAVERRLQQLLERVLADKLRLDSAERLVAALRLGKVRYAAHRPPLCWAADLMRAMDGPCEALSQAGLTPKPEWRRRDIAELSAQVGEDFLRLSRAYHQRYLTVTAQR